MVEPPHKGWLATPLSQSGGGQTTTKRPKKKKKKKNGFWAFGGGQTTPLGHGGGRATLLGQGGGSGLRGWPYEVVWPLCILSLSLFFLRFNF
jgi:hypothetical protein